MTFIMVIKDLKRMLRDRKALTITIMMPAILTVILGFSIGAFFNTGIELEPAKVAVVSNADIVNDQKETQLFFRQQMIRNVDVNELTSKLVDINFEELFIKEVLETEAIKEFILYEYMQMEDAENALADGTLTAIIEIPEKFHYNLWISMFTPFRNDVQLVLRKSSKHVLKGQIVESIVSGYTDHLSLSITGKQVLLEKAAEFGVGTEIYEHVDELMRNLQEIDLYEISIEASTIEGKDPITSFHYYAAGMGVMFMLYSAGFAASYSVSERSLLTYSRMKIAGVPFRTIMSGRFLSCALFTVIQLALLIVFSKLIFQISWGNPTIVIVLTIAASLAVASLAVLISVINLLAGNDRVSELFQSAIIPLMALIGGSFIPNNVLPVFFQNIGNQTVNGSTLNGFLLAMQGYPFSSVYGHLFVLLLYCVLFLAIAAVIAKRKEV